MPRPAHVPDPLITLRTRLRAADHAASEIVLAVESLRAAFRHVVAAVDDLPRERSASPTPPPPRPASPSAAPHAPRFLRSKDVALMCGLSRTTIWRMQREGTFPERRRITTRTVAWLAEEVEEWVRSRERGL